VSADRGAHAAAGRLSRLARLGAADEPHAHADALPRLRTLGDLAAEMTALMIVPGKRKLHAY